LALDTELDLLEASIRQLQVEWERFFGGGEKKPPNELKGRVEALVRKHAHSEIRNNSERFRYQMLVARYNTFAELWAKRLRAREEGHLPGGRQAPVQPPLTRPSPKEAVRVQDPVADQEAVKELFDRLVEARRKAGDTAALKFENFRDIIEQQAKRLLNDRKVMAVDFRLEEKEGKVSLKAKPVRST